MAALPTTRNLELIVSKLNVPGPCCFCGAKDGVLECSQCKAVQYCGEDCQKKGWEGHKTTCHQIRQEFLKTTTEIDVLAKRFGGTSALLETPFFKRGLFNFGTFNSSAPYIRARWSLAESYGKCGEETSSKIAFRLAVENFLDLLCLCRSNNVFPILAYLKGCSWMVEADMDQHAFNLLCYRARRRQSPHPFPYSDMSIDDDIEGVSCITAVQEINRSQFEDTSQWEVFSEICLQTSMLISLIKFRRLQALLVEGRKEDARWNAFIEGTHPGTGELSEVLRLGGVTLVTEKLKKFVVDQSAIKRVGLLAEQINGLLKSVNEKNAKLILEGIDGQTLKDPEFNIWNEEFYLRGYLLDEDLFEEYLESEERVLDSARYAVNIYGHAWHMDREYTRALRLFLDTGNVMAVEKDTGHVKAEQEDVMAEYTSL